MKEEKSTFTVRSYTKSELAHLYNPQLTLKNATQVLRRWILHNAELHAELIHSVSYTHLTLPTTPYV